jgi:PilZ domain
MSPTSAIIEDHEWDGLERRRAKRKLVSQQVLLSLQGQITLQPCSLRDLTALGAGLLLERFNLLPTEFALSFDDFRTSLACRLVWRDRDRGGVEFRS